MQYGNGMPLAWYIPRVSTDMLEEIERVLEGGGLRIAGSLGDDDARPVVLLCGGLDARGVEEIRELSWNQRRMVMVVDCGGEFSARERWAALEAGASDVLAWNGAETLGAIASKVERWDEVTGLVESGAVREHFVGRSPAVLRVIRQLVEIAAFTTAPVLITGESGTGKELAARAIHQIDRRQGKGEFILVDCTTVVPELSGSEFFGHERGAYTGAVGQRDGAFALAHRGTLFLDEVGELPLGLQASLLRAVQERTYKRVGSNEWKAADFRLVCATNRDLGSEQARGTFRRDLYYRIAACTFHLPPLRQRMEDILPLARYFLRQHFGGMEVDFDEAAAGYLMGREYPGNVRDLKQIVGRMAYRHAGQGRVTLGAIPPEDWPNQGDEVPVDWRGEAFRRSVQRAVSMGCGMKEIGRQAEEVAEEIVVREEDGNLQRAARRLGISDRALQMRRAARRPAAG